MKKILLASAIAGVSLLSVNTVSADVAITTEAISPTESKVTIKNTTSGEGDVTFNLGYDSSRLSISGDSNLVTDEETSTIKFKGKNEEGTLTSFTVKKVDGVTDNDFMIGVEDVTVNGSEPDTKMVDLAFEASPIVLDSILDEPVMSEGEVSLEETSLIEEIAPAPVAKPTYRAAAPRATKVSTTNKTGAEDALLVGLMLALGTGGAYAYRRRKA